MAKFSVNVNRESRFILDDTEDRDDEDDLDDGNDWNEEKDQEDLPPDRTWDGQFDYVNDDGIVVPKDANY